MARAAYNPKYPIKTVYRLRNPLVLVISGKRFLGYYLRQAPKHFDAFDANDCCVGVFERAHQAAEGIYMKAKKSRRKVA